MSFTKKVGSQRDMKSIEVWYGLNKTTPDKWFTRWEEFLVPLMMELGYQCQSFGLIQKVRGKPWHKELKFTHPHLDPTVLFLSRKRIQEGGMIHFVYGFIDGKFAYEQMIDTISQPFGYSVMSRQKVGDQVLNHVREGWSKSRNANQES